MPVEAVMIANELDGEAHWTTVAAQAIRAEHPRLARVLGGTVPIGSAHLPRVLDHVEAVALPGFPLDWDPWPLEEWPIRLGEIRAATRLPVWIGEVGISTFGAEWVQEYGLVKTIELVRHRAPRIYWYSLLDLPRSWRATTRHREADGSSYDRHFHMGVIRDDNSPKPAARRLAEVTPDIGVCQPFQYLDPRLDDAVRWLRQMNVRYLRTGLSWSDWGRPGWEAWFDRQMKAVESFDVTLTFGSDEGSEAAAGPPRHPEQYAAFCAEMVRRYVA